MSDSLTGEDRDYELRLQSKNIPYANITASSSLSSNHSPALARLDGQGEWCSTSNDNSPYIQIQFGKKKVVITMIITQGSFEELRRAMKYQIKYFKDRKWVTYQKSDGTVVSVKLLNQIMRLMQHDSTLMNFSVVDRIRTLGSFIYKNGCDYLVTWGKGFIWPAKSIAYVAFSFFFFYHYHFLY